jgi:hypothetical protein
LENNGECGVDLRALPDEPGNTPIGDPQHHQQHLCAAAEFGGYGADGPALGGAHRGGRDRVDDLQLSVLELRFSAHGHDGSDGAGLRAARPRVDGLAPFPRVAGGPGSGGGVAFDAALDRERVGVPDAGDGGAVGAGLDVLPDPYVGGAGESDALRADGLVLRHAKRDVPAVADDLDQRDQYRAELGAGEPLRHGRCRGGVGHGVGAVPRRAAGVRPAGLPVPGRGRRGDAGGALSSGGVQGLRPDQPRHFHPDAFPDDDLRRVLLGQLGPRRKGARGQRHPTAIRQLDVVRYRRLCLRRGEPGGQVRGRRTAGPPASGGEVQLFLVPGIRGALRAALCTGGRPAAAAFHGSTKPGGRLAQVHALRHRVPGARLPELPVGRRLHRADGLAGYAQQHGAVIRRLRRRLPVAGPPMGRGWPLGLAPRFHAGPRTRPNGALATTRPPTTVKCN